MTELQSTASQKGRLWDHIWNKKYSLKLDPNINVLWQDRTAFMTQKIHATALCVEQALSMQNTVVWMHFIISIWPTQTFNDKGLQTL